MGSTYTYLSVMRLGNWNNLTRYQIRWRPFHLLAILQEIKTRPFRDKPAKSAYMWRDIERRAAMYGLPGLVTYALSRQTVHYGKPRGDKWACAAAASFPRCLSSLVSTGQETGSEPNVSESLRDIGQEPQSVLALANATDTTAALMAETDVAKKLGILVSRRSSLDANSFGAMIRLEVDQLVQTRPREFFGRQIQTP